MTRVPVNPELLRWARERTGLAREDLATKIRMLSEWEVGETRPILKQSKAFVRAVRVPVGYMFLAELPVEPVPIQDCRVFFNQLVARPSPNALDTIYICEERQN